MQLWPFIPQRDHSESLAWLTDVLESKGGEQRIYLRTAPRVNFKFKYQMNPLEFANAQSIARSTTHKKIHLPLWSEFTNAGAVAVGVSTFNFDTRYAHYDVGQQILLWDDYTKFELLSIATLSATRITTSTASVNTYANAIICPVIEARFTSPLNVSRKAQERVDVTVNFTGTQAKTLPAPPAPALSYRGEEVLLSRPVLISSIKDVYEREQDLVDFQLGAVALHPERTFPIRKSAMGWDTQDREELWSLRLWLNDKKGKFGTFWSPSWNPDLSLAAPITALDTSLTVTDLGYLAREDVRDFLLVTHSGDHYPARITSWSAGAPGTEIANLETPFPAGVLESEVNAIYFLYLMRFNADRVEFKHKDAKHSTLMVPTIEVLA